MHARLALRVARRLAQGLERWRWWVASPPRSAAGDGADADGLLGAAAAALALAALAGLGATAPDGAAAASAASSPHGPQAGASCFPRGGIQKIDPSRIVRVILAQGPC